MSEQLKETTKAKKTAYDRNPRVKLFANSPLSAAGKRKSIEVAVLPGFPRPYLTKK